MGTSVVVLNIESLQDHIVYVARPAFIDELCRELSDVALVAGNLVFSKRRLPEVCFALDVWLSPQVHRFESISQAVRILNQSGRYWSLNPLECVRRSHLIAEQLKKLPALTTHFPRLSPLPFIGGFSLLDQNTMVFSAKRWKNPPLGDFGFIEDKQNPPNRAYLKLWEALTLEDAYPQPGDVAIDLGASPGGWTYVMQSFGAKVCAVDKAELDPKIAKLPGVHFMQQSAFALEPAELKEEYDWLLSDIACYPERALVLVNKWMASQKAKRLIVTIKLQGKTDLDVLQKFKNIPHARVVHLFANKHEVTFFYPAPQSLLLHFGQSQ